MIEMVADFIDWAMSPSSGTLGLALALLAAYFAQVALFGPPDRARNTRTSPRATGRARAHTTIRAARAQHPRTRTPAPHDKGLF